MNPLKYPLMLGIGAALLAAVPALARPSDVPAESPAPAASSAMPAKDAGPKPRAVAAAGVPFVAPAECQMAFRRDRLPLDWDTMMYLSQMCDVLALGLGGETAVSRRTSAQLLALALALQPDNPEARRILESFARGEPKPARDAAQLATVRVRIWRILAWLETPAAGQDGQALAACLRDVLAIADSQNGRAEDPGKTGEQGAWAGWVQPLDAFNKIDRVVKNDSGRTGPVAVPRGGVTANNPILLAAAAVTTPLWIIDKASPSPVLRPVPVRMQATLKEGWARNEPLSCALENPRGSANGDRDTFRSISATLVKALEQQLDKVPAGVAVSLICGDHADYLIERNHNAISGAAAVLMNAAISGCEPNATIIGEVQADGSFKLPPRFWDKLRALSDDAGGRLVLPREAEKFLPSILTLDDPGFFFKYEVLLASNLQELVERSAKTPPPELAPVTANFLEVRSKLGSQPVAGYVANHFVRLRLQDPARSPSYHASARMLALQGAGGRPVHLPSNMLANELRRVIRPMAWIPSHPVENFQTKPLNEVFATCLRDADHLERYTDLHDRQLHDLVRELVLSVRTLARATRGRTYDPKAQSAPWQKEFDAFSRSYQTVTTALNRAAADG